MKMFAASAAATLMAVQGLPTVKADPLLASDPSLQLAQVGVYSWGGHPYCWYYNGWHGPGWYRCGYPWRTGYGWGGVWGWNGWVGPGAGWWTWGHGHGYHDWHGYHGPYHGPYDDHHDGHYDDHHGHGGEHDHYDHGDHY
jgi:hypothetical protein